MLDDFENKFDELEREVKKDTETFITKLKQSIRKNIDIIIMLLLFASIGMNAYHYTEKEKALFKEVEQPVKVDTVEEKYLKPITIKGHVVTFNLDLMKQGKDRKSDGTVEGQKVEFIGKQFSIDSSNKDYTDLSAYVVLYQDKTKLTLLKDFVEVK